MKTFNKLALATAVATLSTSSFAALQSIDDAQMSQMTGQDGITITIEAGEVTPTTGAAYTGLFIENAYIHDTDGLPTSAQWDNGDPIVGASGVSGVLQVSDIKLVMDPNAPTTIVVDTDGGATTGDSSDAFVNAKINLGATDIDMGTIGVGESADSKTGIVRGVAGTSQEILSGLNVSLGASEINVQLGAQPQGSMAILRGEVTGGLALQDLGITDAANANFGGVGYNKGEGTVYIGNLALADAGLTNLNNDISIGIDDDKGLIIVMKTAGLDVAMERVGFTNEGSTLEFGAYDPIAGTAMTNAGTPVTGTNFIGDIYLQGLQTGNTVIAINGH